MNDNQAFDSLRYKNFGGSFGLLNKKDFYLNDLEKSPNLFCFLLFINPAKISLQGSLQIK
jgi:hypothetical protein